MGQQTNNGAIATCEVGLVVDVHNGGQDERERLAGACLGNTNDVASAQRHGPALRLDGRGGIKLLSAKSLIHIL